MTHGFLSLSDATLARWLWGVRQLADTGCADPALALVTFAFTSVLAGKIHAYSPAGRAHASWFAGLSTLQLFATTDFKVSVLPNCSAGSCKGCGSWLRRS
ncbi:unnamed protein product [Effrenium voratum]|nr:unnamed protein product [Effrenium voratum]